MVVRINWHWQFLLLLILAVITQVAGKSDLHLREDSLNSILLKGIEQEMCKKGDIASQLGLNGDLGFGWHLVREEEREGRCPGTREKVDLAN